MVYVREPERLTDRPTLSAALEGLHFVRRTPLVLATISLDLFAVLFGGAIALIPAVAEERLGVGDIAYGWLRAAPGIGAARWRSWLAVLPIRRRVGPTLLVVGRDLRLRHDRLRAHAELRGGVRCPGRHLGGRHDLDVHPGSIVPLATPDDQLGRVTAVEGVFIGASNELGAFESGVAARVFGLPVAIAGGGSITMVIAGPFAVVVPVVAPPRHLRPDPHRTGHRRLNPEGGSDEQDRHDDRDRQRRQDQQDDRNDAKRYESWGGSPAAPNTS